MEWESVNNREVKNWEVCLGGIYINKTWKIFGYNQSLRLQKVQKTLISLTY